MDWYFALDIIKKKPGWPSCPALVEPQNVPPENDSQRARYIQDNGSLGRKEEKESQGPELAEIGPMTSNRLSDRIGRLARLDFATSSTRLSPPTTTDIKLLFASFCVFPTLAVILELDAGTCGMWRNRLPSSSINVHDHLPSSSIRLPFPVNQGRNNIQPTTFEHTLNYQLCISNGYVLGLAT